MNEKKRLQLIGEAVKYCQRVRNMGMPPGCYAKALREPVHFLWERRIGASPEQISGPKVCAAKFRSNAAKGLSFGKGALIYDHAIPLKYLQDKLLNLSDVRTDSLKKLLNKFCVPALITKGENQRIRCCGYRDRMPEGWNRVDSRARYRAVGIEIGKNKCQRRAKLWVVG